jgi:hypothetical protein
MTRQDIDTLLYYLSKVVVPTPSQDEFFKAVHALQSLKNKANQKAA